MAHDAKGKAQRAWRIAYEDSENSELSNALPYALCALHRIWSIQHRACRIEYRASSIEHRVNKLHTCGRFLPGRPVLSAPVWHVDILCGDKTS